MGSRGRTRGTLETRVVEVKQGSGSLPEFLLSVVAVVSLEESRPGVSKEGDGWGRMSKVKG